MPLSLRITYYSLALAGSLAAFCLYVLLVVPLIEPQIQLRAARGDLPAATSAAELELTHYFPEGAWERGPLVKKIQTRQGLLVFRDYQPLEGGRLELKPLTLMLITEEGVRQRRLAESVDSPLPLGKRPLVIRAEEGAVLHSDGKLDLSQGRVGKPIGGRLMGRVVIQRAATPGADDALWLESRNVDVAMDRIATTQAVKFRYGPHHGSGRDLLLQFHALDRSVGQFSQTPLLVLRTMELVHLERLVVQAPAQVPPVIEAQEDSAFAAALTAGDPRVDTTVRQPSASPQPLPPLPIAPPGAANATRSSAPAASGDVAAGRLPAQPDGAAQTWTITSRGPLRLDIEHRTASLSDRVAIQTAHPNGVDLLRCELIEVRFGDDPKVLREAEPSRLPPRDPAGLESPALGGLVVQSIVATGSPLQLEATSLQATARGERLEFDYQTGMLTLAGHRVSATYRGQHLQAASVQYELNPVDPQQLGKLWAAGPGRIDGPLDEGGRLFTAKWGRMLSLQPYEQNYVISLFDSAELLLDGAGEVRAKEVHAYLNEIVELGDRSAERRPPPKFVPDRLLATGDVQIESGGVRGFTREVNVWFRPPRSQTLPVQPAVADRQPPPAADVQRGLAVAGQAPRQPLDVRGELVQVRMVLDPQGAAALDEVSVLGNVSIENRDPNESFSIRGERLHFAEVAERGQAGSGQLEISGAPARRSPKGDLIAAARPAVISLRGATIEGKRLILDRAANRVWMEQGGKMTLPLQLPAAEPAAPAARPPARPGPPVVVTWAGRMQFDGRIVSFSRDVNAGGQHALEDGRTLHFSAFGQQLEAELDRLIAFQDAGGSRGGRQPAGAPAGGKQPALHELRFVGDVVMHNRTFRGNQQESFEQLHVRDLVLDHPRGQLRAAGPGWVSSVRPQSTLNANAPRRPAPPGQFADVRALRPQPGGGSADALFYLRVDYAGELVGSLSRRNVQFRNQVRTVVGPVNGWDQRVEIRDQGSMHPRSAELTCDQLTVSDVGNRAQASLVLEALGNTQVVAKSFLAYAERISFDQAKDMLVLESSTPGRTKLKYQNQTLALDRMIYFPKTGNMKIENGRQADVTLPPQR